MSPTKRFHVSSVFAHFDTANITRTLGERTQLLKKTEAMCAEQKIQARLTKSHLKPSNIFMLALTHALLASVHQSVCEQLERKTTQLSEKARLLESCQNELAAMEVRVGRQIGSATLFVFCRFGNVDCTFCSPSKSRAADSHICAVYFNRESESAWKSD